MSETHTEMLSRRLCNQDLRYVLFAPFLRRVWEREVGGGKRSSYWASEMMKSAVRAVHSCVLQRLRVQLDSDVHASVFGPAAALRLCSSRMFSDESHASNQHLDRGQVVARVLEVVKTHQKVDPSKVWLHFPKSPSPPLPSPLLPSSSSSSSSRTCEYGRSFTLFG